MTQNPHKYLYDFLTGAIAEETMILLPTEEGVDDFFATHPGRRYFNLIRSAKEGVRKEHFKWMAEEAVSLLRGVDPRIQAGLKAVQEGVAPDSTLLGLMAVRDYFRAYPGEEGSLGTLVPRRLTSTVASLLLDINLPTLVTEPIRDFSRAFQYEDICEDLQITPEAKLKGWKLALEDLQRRTADLY